MDKLYFDGSDSGVPKALRAAYSDLSNIIFSYLRDESSVQDIRDALMVITKGQGLEPSPATQAIVKEQLRSCCYFWEDTARYECCWEVLDKLFRPERSEE